MRRVQNFNRDLFSKEMMPVWTEMITRWRMERGGHIDCSKRNWEGRRIFMGSSMEFYSMEKHMELYWVGFGLMLRTDCTCWAECHPLSPRETWCWGLLGFLIWPGTPWFYHWLLTPRHFGTKQGPSLLRPWFQLMASSFFSLIVRDFFGNHPKLLYPTSTLILAQG